MSELKINFVLTVRGRCHKFFIEMKKVSKKQFWFLHFLVFLSLLALWGYLETGNKYLVLCAVLSFYGALCLAFRALLKR